MRPGGGPGVRRETEQASAGLRLVTLARLADDLALAKSPDEVAERAIAVLVESLADRDAIWLFDVIQPEYVDTPGAVALAAASPGVEQLTPAAHSLALEAVRSLQPEDLPRTDDPGAGSLHAIPIIEPGQSQPSVVLVAARRPDVEDDQQFAAFLDLTAALIGAGLSGLRDLAVERQRSQTLLQLDAAKSAFLANVSHELRTPLALISGPIHDALTDPDHPLESHTTQRLLLVQSNVVRLARMVDAMLDFSRMEAGRIVPTLVALDVAELTRSLAVSFAPAIERAGLAFSTDIPDLPRLTALDRDIYERMVLNLLSNALKYTPRGSITIRLRDAGDRFAVSVTDTGIGIALKDHERVFQRFEQLPRQRLARSPEGAGIGLAMVKQLSELLGGSVTLRSTPGRGSEFTITLPYRSIDVVAPSEPEARSITPRGADSFLAEVASWEHPGATPPRPVSAEDDSSRLRLLIVEDSADMGRYLSEVLSDEYAIELARDGLQALAAVRRSRPAAVLSDVMMPGLDGFGLVRELRNDPALHDIPVLLLSARAGQEAAAIGLEHGADDYLVKPFSVQDLRARLASNIRRAQDRTRDAAWRRAIVASLQEGMLIADSDGLVTEMNEAFTRLLGWSMADGPLRPPYPWWPSPEDEPEAYQRVSAAHHAISETTRMEGEYLLRRKDGAPVWASYYGMVVADPERGRTAVLKTLRDVTREHAAQQRRAAAARVTADFTDAADLTQVLETAVAGFGTLFDGEVTVEVVTGGSEMVFTATGPIAPDELDSAVRAQLSHPEASGDADTPVAGIRLAPQSSVTGCRAWVRFAFPRVVATDERIVGDILAQAFALALDRVVEVGELADRQGHLERAVESHRLIGQAVGILLERHKLTPAAAFTALKRASQDRNIKIRDLAQRVIETGLDPSAT